jgi:hypothetical protein
LEALQYFPEYKTYRWLPNPETGDRRVDNEIVERRITDAVDRELAAKGYRRLSSGKSDFLVGYHAAIQRELKATHVNSYYGYGDGWFPYTQSVYGDTYLQNYLEGTLILDIVDGKADVLVWRGSALAELDTEADQGERDKQVDNAVKKILEGFPPEN